MIESRQHTDRRAIFREVFTPQSISKNNGVITGDRGIYIDFGSSGDWGFYDGTTDLTAEAAVTYFNRQHLVVTKTGTSYKFYRKGILVNTVVGVDNYGCE